MFSAGRSAVFWVKYPPLSGLPSDRLKAGADFLPPPLLLCLLRVADQPFAPEREIPVTGNDEVVQQPDVEQCGGPGYPIGQGLVLRTCLGGSRGVVVDQDNLCGEQLQRAFDDQPMVDHRSRHTALAYALTFDDAVRGGEVHRPALFMGQAFELRTEQMHDIVARGDKIGIPGSGHCDSASEFRGEPQHPGPSQPEPSDHAQPGFGFGGEPGQRPSVGGQQDLGQRLILDEQGQQLPVIECFDAPGRHFVANVLHGCCGSARRSVRQAVDLVQQRSTLLVGQVLRYGECGTLFRLLLRASGSVSDLHVVDHHRAVK